MDQTRLIRRLVSLASAAFFVLLVAVAAGAWFMSREDVALQEITQAYWEIPAAAGSQGGRACPACGVKMTVEKYHSVEIDRCATDGVWFDEAELQAMLIDSTQPKSTGGWLSRLFGKR